MRDKARPPGSGQIALTVALLALLAACVIAWTGFARAPEPSRPGGVCPQASAPAPPLETGRNAAAGLQRQPIAGPGHGGSQLAEGIFTVHVAGVVPELLPYLRVQCTTADLEQRLLAVLQPDATGALRIAAPAPMQHLAVRTARGDRLLVDQMTSERKILPLAGGEVTFATVPALAGIQLVDRDGARRPFALGIEQPATDLELRPVQVADATEQALRFFVALGAGPQLCIGREGLRTDGPIWTLDLRHGTPIAEVRVRPVDGMRSAPRQLNVAAAGDRQYNAVRMTSGWVLALEPGDYDLYWLPSGPRLPLCSGVHLEPGESRELQVSLPATSVCRGDIANWQQLQPRLRPRMVRIGAIRANIDRADGTFELLLAEPLPATLEVELSRFTTDSFSMAARPARVLDRDDADGRLLIEDTFAELPRMRVRCESQHDGAIGIQVYRRVPTPHLYCIIAADDEVLLPDGDQELLLMAIEKVGQRSWPLAMQVVPCVPGEVVLQPSTREVPVAGCSDGWWITTFPAAPWQTCEVGVSVFENSTVLLPTSAAGARARRGEVVREFPAPVTLIDLR